MNKFMYPSNIEKGKEIDILWFLVLKNADFW